MTPPFLFDYTSWDDWEAWLDAHALRLLVIVALLVFAHWLFRRVLSRMFSRAIARTAAVSYEDRTALERRVNAFSATLNWALGLLLMFVGSGLVLAEFGLNVSALIAGVGVVGIALGLGAQTLVKDVINGLFILLEDQYAVGDVVQVGGVSGEVIEVTPRRTVLRDLDGNVHVVPNSAITVATNRTASLNRVVVEIEVPFREVEDATALVRTVAGEVMAERARDFSAAPRVAEVRALGDGDVVIRVVADAGNGSRWEAEAELRRRLKRRFEVERVAMRFAGGGAPEPAKA